MRKTSVEEKLLKGNPGRRKEDLMDHALKAPTDLTPMMPEYMLSDPIATNCFKSVVDSLASLNIASDVDSKAIELLANAYSQYRQAETEIKEHGITIDAPSAHGGVVIKKKNPAVAISQEARKFVKSMLIELGLTVNSRNKMTLKIKNDEIDEFGIYMLQNKNPEDLTAKEKKTLNQAEIEKMLKW